MRISSIEKKVISLSLLTAALAASGNKAHAQVPVSSYNLSTIASTDPSTSNLNVPGYNLNSANVTSLYKSTELYDVYYAQKNTGAAGNVRKVTGFVAGGQTYIPVNASSTLPYNKVTINRVEPATAYGNKYTALYEYSEVTNSTGTPIANPTSILIPGGAKTYLETSREATMEDFMNSFSLNKGTDNTFVNDNTASTFNNIERVDLVYSSGIIATNKVNLLKLGFIINERGGNDAFKIAAITGINGSNIVTGLGPLIPVTADKWGQSGPSLKTAVIQKDAASSQYKPSQIIAAQTISGIYMSLESLGIPVNTRIYGIAIFPNDASGTPAQLLSLSNAVTTTDQNQSGMDLMSGNFVARDITYYISGNVFNDANGLSGTPANMVDGIGIGSPASTTPIQQLYANLLNTTGNVVTTVPVQADGTYTFPYVAAGTYSVQITINQGVAGQAAPVTALPATWVYTGENIGTQAGSDNTPDGRLNNIVINDDVSNVNFGIEQIPTATAKSFTVARTIFSGTPPATYPAITGFSSIQSGNANLTGYNTTGGRLSGTDPEDCAAANACNTGSTFTIGTINANTRLYYNFGAGPVLVAGNTVIADYDPAKLVIYGQSGSGTSGNPVGFTYSITDAAGKASPFVAYSIIANTPLPVSLSSFTVTTQNCTALLNWTATTQKAARFEVEMSHDSKLFNRIAVLEGRNGLNGESYDYVYQYTGNGQYFFRLKMTETDGSFTYTPVLTATGNCATASVIISPNPAFDIVTVSGLAAQQELTVTDATGRQLIQLISTGSRQQVNLSDFPAGIYILRISNNDGSAQNYKIVKH